MLFTRYFVTFASLEQLSMKNRPFYFSIRFLWVLESSRMYFLKNQIPIQSVFTYHILTNRPHMLATFVFFTQTSCMECTFCLYGHSWPDLTLKMYID